MPMRNAASYVEAALRSVLVEDSVPLEVVVTDDGSTDSSRAVVEGLGDARVRIIDGPCKGIAGAFNAALDASRGDIVMRCDADDLYPAARISRQAAWLDSHSEFGAICGGFLAMDARGGAQLPLSASERDLEITSELQAGKTRTHFCTFAIRAEVLRDSGGMRSFFQTGEDIDLQLRIGEATRVWYSPEVAYHYRIHDASITHQRHELENHFFENLAREFQSQRKLRGADDLSLGKAPDVPDFGAADAASARSHMQSLHIGATWAAAVEGDYRRALRHAVHGVRASPGSLKGWRNLLVVLAKLGVSAVRTH
jgi:glycosyltransferase involved in cell wall biosynthesis